MGPNGIIATSSSVAVVQPTRAMRTVAPVDTSANPRHHQQNFTPEPKKQGTDRCCWGAWSIQRAALLIALMELAFFAYHMVAASLSYDKTGDEYAFTFSFALLCFAIAILAVGLLLIGIRKQAPYFLIPHLLVQFAMITSTFLLAAYLVMLLIGGTSVRVDAIFYEDSARGELGLSQASRLEPIRASTTTHELNTILLSSLFAVVAFLVLQVWFFFVVRRLFNFLRNQKRPASKNGKEIVEQRRTEGESLRGNENGAPAAGHLQRIRNGTNV